MKELTYLHHQALVMATVQRVRVTTRDYRGNEIPDGNENLMGMGIKLQLRNRNLKWCK